MRVDFKKVRESLERSSGKLAGQRDERAISEVLRLRSQRLAMRQTVREEAVETFAEVVVVIRGEASFGIPVTSVKEVRSVEITWLPHATKVIAGLFQIRGRTYSLVDIGAFFGQDESLEHGASTLVAVVKGAPGSIGLSIDDVIGHRAITHDEIDDAVHVGTLGFVSHVTRDLVQLIDIDTLLALPAVRISKGRHLR